MSNVDISVVDLLVNPWRRTEAARYLVCVLIDIDKSACRKQFAKAFSVDENRPSHYLGLGTVLRIDESPENGAVGRSVSPVLTERSRTGQQSSGARSACRACYGG